MKRNFSSNSCSLKTFGLAILFMFAIQPASATIYKFALPVSQLQTALTSVITEFPVGSPGDEQLFAFYDVYLRAAVVGDGFGGTIMSNPTNLSATPPIDSNQLPDGWNSTVNVVAPNDVVPQYLSIHFTYNAIDSVIAVITPNANVNGVTLEPGKIGEKMPVNNLFTMNISSPITTYAGSNVSFAFYAVAYQFASSSMVGGPTFKGSSFYGNVDVLAQYTPEPVSFLTGGGGILLLALVGLRRKRAAK